MGVLCGVINLRRTTLPQADVGKRGYRLQVLPEGLRLILWGSGGEGLHVSKWHATYSLERESDLEHRRGEECGGGNFLRVLAIMRGRGTSDRYTGRV